MHILYLHQYFATQWGTTGTRSYEFAKRWVAAGHRVTMLTSVAQLTREDLGRRRPRLVTRLDIDGIDVMALNVVYRQSMGFARRLWAFLGYMVLATWLMIRLPGIDVVYATSTPLTVGIPALAGRWLRRRRYVFEVRDAWPAVPIAMGVIRSSMAIHGLRWLERAIYRGAEAVVALSPGMAELVRCVAPQGKRVETIPNCADTSLFHPDVDGGEVRRRRGWEGRFVCLHVGAMGRANGLDVVVRAAHHFRTDSEFLFVLLGDGGEKRSLRAEADRLQLSNLQIVDSVMKRDLPALLAAADLGLVTFARVPVLEHNSANKLFDYLSAGKPVLLNYSGWQRQLLESYGAGLGSTLGDDSSFWANLAMLKADKERRICMGRNARKLAEKQFNRDALAAKALRVIVETAGSPAGASIACEKAECAE